MDIFRTLMHFMRINITFYDVVNKIHDVIRTAKYTNGQKSCPIYKIDDIFFFWQAHRNENGIVGKNTL